MRHSQPLVLVILALSACAGPRAEHRVAYGRSEARGDSHHELLGGPTALSVSEPLTPAPVEPTPEPAPDLDGGAVSDTLGGGLVVTGATSRPLVLFTFDDGPDPGATPAILDTLDRFEVRAVFFVVPARLAEDTAIGRTEAALLREIVRRGHYVGSHSMHHVHLHTASAEDVEAEIVLAEEAIAATLGARPVLFRPPGGARSEVSDTILRARGYTQMLWNVVTADFLTRDASTVVRTFRRSLRGRIAHGSPGGIVLLHDTHAWTAEALPELLSFVESENCARLARGEELIDPSPDPAWFVVPAGADPSTSAPAAAPPDDAYHARQALLSTRAIERCH